MKFVKTFVMKRKTQLESPKTSNKGDTVQDVLDALAYNFSQFKLHHFVDHIAQIHNRRIFVVPFPFTSTIFGVWVHATIGDYILCNNTLQPIHQTHIVLHEIAHILLEHRRQRIDDVLPPELLQQIGESNVMGRLRVAQVMKNCHNEEEEESELFVYLIQRQLMQANRLAELTGESSSIPQLKPITDAMGYTEG